MTHPIVEIVIACHDERRPLERAVASVVQDVNVRDRVRVTVVAHGLDAEPLRNRLADIAGDIRVLPFADGIRSAAGPFNYGLANAEAEYCGVMGSDDFLEPGTMSGWVRHVIAERPDAAIAQIRQQGEAVMPNPLVRLGRRRQLDAAKDRLFYRTAPLGLIRTARMRELGLRMLERVRVGEDFEFGIRLWAQGGRIDFLKGLGSYVIGEDAADRTTLAVMTMEERLEPIVRLLDDGVFDELSMAQRTALAVKLIRVSIVGNAHALTKDLSEADVRRLASLLQRLLDVDPKAILPFNRQDRLVIEALLGDGTSEAVAVAVGRGNGAGRSWRWLTPDLLHSFDRESTLRRYVLYFCKRERGRTT